MRKLLLFLFLLLSATPAEPSRLLAQNAGGAVGLGVAVNLIRDQVTQGQYAPAINGSVALLRSSPEAAPQVTPFLRSAMEGDLKTLRQTVASTTATGTVCKTVETELNGIQTTLRNNLDVLRLDANSLGRISLIQQMYDIWADSYCRRVDILETASVASGVSLLDKSSALNDMDTNLAKFQKVLPEEKANNSAHLVFAQARVRAYAGKPKEEVNRLLNTVRLLAGQDATLLPRIEAFDSRFNDDKFATLKDEEDLAAKNAPAPTPAGVAAAPPLSPPLIAQVIPPAASPVPPGAGSMAPAPAPGTVPPPPGPTPAVSGAAFPPTPSPVPPVGSGPAPLTATPGVPAEPGEVTLTATPAPTAPAPSPVNVGNIVGTVQGYWDTASRPVFNWFDANRDVAYPIGIAIVILWVIPMLLLKAHLVLGDYLAAAFKDKIKHWGALGYVSLIMAHVARRKRMVAANFGAGATTDGAEGLPRVGETAAPAVGGWLSGMFSGISRRGESKANAARRAESVFFCPACRKPTDIIHDYRGKHRFDACPHCGRDIEPIFECEDYLKEVIRQLAEMADRKNEKRKWRKEDEQLEAETMTHLTDTMFMLAVQRRASDVHVERGDTGASLQMRVDGMLTQPILFPKSVALSFLSALKVQANLDITNHTTPQDGRRSQSIDGVEYDMRINCAPTPQGEIFFMRLLDPRQINMSLKDLGFEGAKLAAFDQAIHKPFGLILVTGPTGAGKSTTLYVALNQVNTGERNIITIEDPVEYQIPGLKQMQVIPEKNFTFATGLRSILRQDPDIIMIGEIRDKETAGMAIEAAGTGHLVMTTLHTMDTAQAVSRLSELGVSAKRYAPALEVVLAQRLVRTICYACKQPVEPTDADLERVGILKMRHQIHFMGGKGCRVCNHTGYHGRMAILEMLKPDEKMHALLENETRPHVVRDYARRNGMRLLREEAVMKVAAGLTTIEEVIRVAC